MQSLVLFYYFYVRLQHVSRFKRTLVFQGYTFTFGFLNNIYVYVYLKACILSFNYYLLDKSGNERYKVGEI